MAASGGGGSSAPCPPYRGALITTAFGLIVRHSGGLALQLLHDQDRLPLRRDDVTSKELIDYLIKSVGSEFGRSIFTKEFQTQKASQTSGPVSH